MRPPCAACRSLTDVLALASYSPEAAELMTWSRRLHLVRAAHFLGLEHGCTT